VTVHEDDAEAEHIWRNVVGLPSKRVAHGGEDNWWSMGAGAGPVGPCSEIFWDQEQEVDGERWLELWNLVFMEHLRDEQGGLSPLPRPCVDTGMGLERIASVLQGVPSNYHTDGFDPIFNALAELTGLDGANWRGGKDEQSVAARIIADHLRAVCFLLCDGVVPSNVGRGYTFRRVLRRAVRHGAALGLDRPFLSELLPVLAERSEEWPHIAQRLDRIVPTVRQEEELFLRTMSRGLELLSAEMAQVEKDAAATFDPLAPGGSSLQLSAASTFQLYDTYGFPLDLTATIASERGFEVDLAGAARLMEQQRTRARASGGVGEATKESSAVALPAEVSTAWQRSGIAVPFSGYDALTECSVRVVAVEMDENSDGAWIALERSAFYPTSGGQVGDVGFLAQAPAVLTAAGAVDGAEPRQCEIVATVRPYPGAIACRVVPAGDEETLWLPRVGEYINATVSAHHRRGCSAHHTATHMLAAALRAVLPPETSLVQAGSEVSPQRLRYDCSGVGGTGLPSEVLQRATELVNDAIRRGLSVQTQEMSVDQAVANGAIADFGEKYGDLVRVVTIGSVCAPAAYGANRDATEAESRRFDELLLAGELCGGTHVSNTSELSAFTIVKEGGVGAGTRRVEALTAGAAYDWHEGRSKMLDEIASSLKVPVGHLAARVAKLAAEHKDMRKAAAKGGGRGKSQGGGGGAAGGEMVSVGSDARRLVLHDCGQEEVMGRLRDFAAEAAKGDAAATHIVIGAGHIVVRCVLTVIRSSMALFLVCAILTMRRLVCIPQRWRGLRCRGG
jgi:alanyl-tRNA synthetase